MRILLPLALLTLLSYDSTAQRWNLNYKNSIDFIAGLDYNFRMLSADSNEDETWLLLARRGRMEKIPMSIRLGFNYNFYLSERFSLKSGLRFTNPGYQTTLLQSSKKEVIADAHPSFFENTKQINLQKYYLEIPLMVRYVYSELWCKSYVEAGVSTNMYLGSTMKSIKEDGSSERVGVVEDITKLNVMANLAIGGEFLIYEIPFFIQLITRIQLTETKVEQINERLVGMGIETGMRYEF